MNQLKRQLLADKKRLGVMIVLAVFGLLMWGRLLLRDVPRTATAVPKAPRAAASSPADNEPRPSPRAGKVEVVRVDPHRRLSRDLFSFDPNRYKRTITAEGGGNFFTPENSQPESTDDMGVAEALELARRLDLQSVLTGARPRAVINNTLLAPGGRVEGWELLEVVDRYVYLEQNGIVIRLWM